jgi:hypothetical protein
MSESLLALIELAKREESRGWIVSLDYERVAAEFGFSDRSLYRWKKRCVENGGTSTDDFMCHAGNGRFHRGAGADFGKSVVLGYG